MGSGDVKKKGKILSSLLIAKTGILNSYEYQSHSRD